MERPSHTIFDRHQSFSRRASLFAMAIGLQLAGFWLFTHGLASHVPGIIHVINFVDVHDKQTPRVKPPEPVLKKVDVPVVPKPVYDVEKTARDNAITGSIVLHQTDRSDATHTDNVVHAPVGILSTHTVPPYPPVARRIGAEGQVTLRLTVSAEGRVTQAEIVTTSGRDELDQTAQQWIVAHWAYRPALENGVPAVSHVLATVAFSLSAGR
ncbi:MAG TPA: energy transducer TonB [Rhizomicrobium sp.]|jgi:protein TonB|nr:energy transducer TonB [Rhizomicrobium sp.]